MATPVAYLDVRQDENDKPVLSQVILLLGRVTFQAICHLDTFQKKDSQH